MIEFELNHDFVLTEKIFLSGILSNNKKSEKNWKMKMKSEEEKNQLLVELCYNYHFHSSDSLILDHHHCEKKFSKILNQSKDVKQTLLLVDSMK